MRRISTTPSLVAAATAFLAANVGAQNFFSRSCALEDIPAALRPPLFLLVDLIGAAPSGTFDYLKTADSRGMRNHYIFESLTVDYFNVRYVLYAENQVYVLYCPGAPQTANNTCSYRIDHTFKSGGPANPNGWVAQTLDSLVIGDIRLNVFFANRAFLYSARAGHPNLIQDLRRPEVAGRFYVNPTVVGHHSYRDQVGSEIYLGKSVARDCNLGEWGFGNR